VQRQRWRAVSRNQRPEARILVRGSAEKWFSESSVFCMRRLPMFFNVIWFSLFFSFQVIKRRALKICLLETSVLLTITNILKRRTTYSYFDFGLKNSSFRLPYQRPSSSVDCARELLNGLKESASLVDYTRKKFFDWGVRIFCD